MSAKQKILSALPQWLATGLRGGRVVAKNLPHAAAQSVTLEPMSELLGVLRGRARVPAGSIPFFTNFFRVAEKKVTPCHFIDVGANDGWFVTIAHRFLTGAPKITCYEPLRSKRAELDALARAHPGVSVRGVAVGEKRGTAEINEIASTGLSSLRDFDPSYVSYSKDYDTRVENRYAVEVVTLDDELDAVVGEHESVVLKIDTQGYELQVLLGARRWLASGRVKMILMELMTIQKYSGASLYDEILNYVHAQGFSMFDIFPGYHEPNGYLSEFDIVLVHRSVRFEELLAQPRLDSATGPSSPAQ